MKHVKIPKKSPANPLSFAEQLSNAKAFFNDRNLPGLPMSEDDNGGFYSDKEGLIQFIVGNELHNDPTIMEKLNELKKTMIGITSVVTDYINRYAETYGQQHKMDPELWNKALSNIPLMGPGKIEEQVYSRRVIGVDIATEFLDFILDVVASEGSDALNSFRDFLKKQGEAIRFGIDENTDSYSTITLGISVEAYMAEEQVVYVPKIKQYRVNFTRNNSTFTSLCVTVEEVNIDFDYKYSSGVFDYESLEDPEIKEYFDQFLQNQRKAQIDKANTFFNADFPVSE